MRIVIIEDEEVSYRNLVRKLEASTFDIQILVWLKNVKQAIQWFRENRDFDLMFLDVQLGDGLSFDIFKTQKINCPVIFTTAFDKYALKAFELDSIDFLLKPYSQEKLDKALTKFDNSSKAKFIQQKQFAEIINKMQSLQVEYKDRFHVKKGKNIYVVHAEDIAWLYRHDYVFLMTKDKQKYIIDYSLDYLMEKLNPKYFYRVNRQFIVHIDSITKMETLFNYKLKVELSPTPHIEVFVAKDKARSFKEWLG